MNYPPKRRPTPKERREARKLKARYQGYAYPCLHVSGLDAKYLKRCKVKMLEDKYVFKVGRSKLELPKSSITGILKETEEYIGYVERGFSHVRALVGVITFGMFGGFLGMDLRPPREVKRKSTYLIFERFGDAAIVLLCDRFIPEIGAPQYPRKFIEDFERGEGYRKQSS